MSRFVSIVVVYQEMLPDRVFNMHSIANRSRVCVLHVFVRVYAHAHTKHSKKAQTRFLYVYLNTHINIYTYACISTHIYIHTYAHLTVPNTAVAALSAPRECSNGISRGASTDMWQLRSSCAHMGTSRAKLR